MVAFPFVCLFHKDHDRSRAMFYASTRHFLVETERMVSIHNDTALMWYRGAQADIGGLPSSFINE